MAGHKALGRGLDALLGARPAQPLNPLPAGTAAPVAPEAEIRQIPVGNIKPNRHQPRTEFDAAAIEELSQSIRTHGLAQPLMVTETGVPGEYELVVGERRLRASRLAGLATVPCTVRKLSNRERFEVALIENIQRQDLNALEEAVALDGLMREYSLTQEEVAAAIGKSRSTVANTLRLLRLHEQVQQAVREGKISEGHAKCLAGLADHAEQLRLLERVLSEGLSVRELEALVANEKPSRKGEAPTKHVMPEVRRYEEMFQRILGRRVELKTNGSKGHLKIEFYSPEDLDTLCGRLGLVDKSIDTNPGS